MMFNGVPLKQRLEFLEEGPLSMVLGLALEVAFSGLDLAGAGSESALRACASA
jgi:hypothetical protein